MTSFSVLGAVIGLAAGLGVWTVILRWPRNRMPDLDDRIAPYVRSGPTSRLLRAPGRSTALGSAERILGPALREAARGIERLLGGAPVAVRRLEQSGRGTSLEQFRAEQVLWGSAGALLGLVVAGLAVAMARGPGAVGTLLLLVSGIVFGVLGRDQWLNHQVRRRHEQMVAEFPAVADLLALAVGAGEGIPGALERVTRTCQGELPQELGFLLAQTRAGMPLAQALQGLADRTALPPLAQFVDGIVIALDRGTPMADVLRAQAQDVRELSRRRLIEVGGKKEIAMMIPVVFLLLPVTVLFALFPGLVILDLSP